MSFRLLTIAREYGSGGAHIGELVAERLSWRLLDQALIADIARRLKVDPQVLEEYVGRVDPWLHRLSRRALWRGALEGVASVTETDFLDAETLCKLTRTLIEEAHREGNCVIIGRGGQCALQDRPDVFHAFVYAPWQQRIARAERRVQRGEDIEELIRATDMERAQYIRLNYGCDWRDPHLYHLMVSSSLGEELAASPIISAIRSDGQ